MDSNLNANIISNIFSRNYLDYRNDCILGSALGQPIKRFKLALMILVILVKMF